ncbi:MAG: VWA domain-containing protein [Planctomycetota bacterium]|jgi:DNA-directed RNA polymerase subunit RPC12/RpoP
MAVEFRCEHCGSLLSADAEAGAEVECPDCGKGALVPAGLAALPHPQVPPEVGESESADVPPPLPERPPEGQAGEGGFDEDEEEEFGEPSEFMQVLAKSVPWLISIFANAAAILILSLITLLVIYTGMPQDIVVPDATLSENPGGSINPTASESAERSRTVRPTPTREFSKKESLSVDTRDSDDAVELIGSAAGGASGGSPFGLTGGGGGGPASNFYGTGGNAHHIVWVIDRSGSVAPNFGLLKQEMLRSVATLKPVQDFHVILFGEDVPIEKEPRQLTAANKKYKLAVAEFLSSVNAAAGYTKPVSALERAFAVLRGADPSKPGKLIYLLTDGVFPDNEAVINKLRALNKTKGVLINTYLYSPERNELAEKVMKQIASENGGRYKYVSPDEVYD